MISKVHDTIRKPYISVSSEFILKANVLFFRDLKNIFDLGMIQKSCII